MRIITKVASAAILLLASSFAAQAGYNFVGTYGVSKTDPSQIHLTINQDHTYTYRENRGAKGTVEIRGNWEMKGKTVVLNNTSSDMHIHNKWRFKQEGKIAKSRRGLSFYTLGKL